MKLNPSHWFFNLCFTHTTIATDAWLWLNANWLRFWRRWFHRGTESKFVYSENALGLSLLRMFGLWLISDFSPAFRRWRRLRRFEPPLVVCTVYDRVSFLSITTTGFHKPSLYLMQTDSPSSSGFILGVFLSKMDFCFSRVWMSCWRNLSISTFWG